MRHKAFELNNNKDLTTAVAPSTVTYIIGNVVGMKYIASFSAGKDSTCMILKLLELKYPLDEILFYSTGIDFDPIVYNARKMEALAKANGIKFTWIEPDKPFLWYMLEKPVKKADGTISHGYGFCGGCCRFGTGLKREALHRTYQKYGDEPIVEYIGYAADEYDRWIKARQKRDGNRIKVFPLIELGITESQALQYCHENGWYWRIKPEDDNSKELYSPGALRRVSCKYCSNKGLDELRFIFHEMNDTVWHELRGLQSRIPWKFRKNASIFDLEERFKREDNLPKQETLF